MASPVDATSSLNILQNGEVVLKGQFTWGSNYTFLVQVSQGSVTLSGVYKPNRGVQPLWDFPAESLPRREVAAYLVSEALGWDLVPPTIYRRMAPLGPGSIQLYVEHDPEYHYFSFSEPDHQRLRPVALFDLLVNNGDRKGTHILMDKDRHLWLIDHGICFHEEEKLRTVIWEFAGEAIPAGLRADLQQFIVRLTSDAVDGRSLATELMPYLSAPEIAALGQRAARLQRMKRFPKPSTRRRAYPWPPI
jgi:uncharacterized repeat protein (TIGR03843 family)